ncbi:MAG: hypothetical protein J7515_06480 [Caulobacter sp.]|nr:hypothetical protein [Caulobacter sp.]
MLAEIVKLPLDGMIWATATLYFAFFAMALWRARIVGLDNIRRGYRLDPKASRPEMIRGYVGMVLFGSTEDRPLRALFWLTRLTALLFVLLMLMTSAIISSPYRMSLR